MSTSERHYYPIFDHIVNYSYDLQVEPDGTLIGECVTDTFTHITGYSLEEVNTRGGWLSLIHMNDIPVFMKHLGQLLSGQSQVTEFRIITKNGETRWLCDYAQPVWGEIQNRVIRIYGTAQDVTQYKRHGETWREPVVRYGKSSEMTDGFSDLGFSLGSGIGFCPPIPFALRPGTLCIFIIPFMLDILGISFQHTPLL